MIDVIIEHWLQILVIFFGVSVLILLFVLGYVYRMWRELKEFDELAKELRLEFLESIFAEENPDLTYYENWEFYRRKDGVVEVRKIGASKE